MNNWFDKEKQYTLLRRLMMVESLYEKAIVKKSATKKSWKGRLFYAIIPNSVTKQVTFYYSNANYIEGRSVARGLPCFIKESLLLDPSFYCSSQFLSEALLGEWDNDTRMFLTEGEKIESNKLLWLSDTMTAVNTKFLSIAQQKAKNQSRLQRSSLDFSRKSSKVAPEADLMYSDVFKECHRDETFRPSAKGA